jgi:trans-aconitate methyltransferase
MDFSMIATDYEAYSSVQKSAAEVLLKILEIGDLDDVLDVGCGTGHLTRKIRELTKGQVTGIDPSDGMIQEAVKQIGNADITFERKSAEEIAYRERFDVIICNSSLQWFQDPPKAIKNCFAALRKGGRMGVQAPAKKIYSPNFIQAVEKIKENPRTKEIFGRFKEPWFFLETVSEYKDLFEKAGLNVVFSRLESVKTGHTPEEVFNIFSSGAMAGYLNPAFYDVDMGKDYIQAFEETIKEAFVQQVGYGGKVELIFHRIFLMAIKEQ